MEKKFDKQQYDIDYRKRFKKQFNVDLNIEEYNELNDLLTKHNLTKVQFLRNAISSLKKSKKK